MTTTSPPPDRGLTYTGLGGMALLAINGFAGGFDHTVKLARLNESGAFWDISVAACIEVLALVGTVMLVLFHRRGWPIWGPATLIVVGVVATLAAQVAYRAAPEPNVVIGYAVGMTPSIVTMLALLVGHLWYEYSRAETDPDTAPEVAGTPVVQVPAAIDVPAALPVVVPVPQVPAPVVPAPHPIPVQALPRAAQQRDPVPAPASAPTEDDDQLFQERLKAVRQMPVNARTGKPGVKRIKEAVGCNQDMAYRLRDEAFPGSNNTTEQQDKITKEEENQAVTERNSEAGKGKGGAEGDKAEGKEKRTGTIATSVDQGSGRPAADPEETPLHLVVGGRA